MQFQLLHIASIQTGLFAKTVLKGEIAYLQLKDFDECGLLKTPLQLDLPSASVTAKHLLNPGDLLFASKGTRNFAAAFQNTNQPAVASTSFFVIRIKENFKNKILSEYLSWFINQPLSQKFLKGNAIGTSIVSIPKSVLSKLEISIPTFEKQKTVLQINTLYTKEKKIKQKIASLRDHKIQQQINNLIK